LLISHYNKPAIFFISLEIIYDNKYFTLISLYHSKKISYFLIIMIQFWAHLLTYIPGLIVEKQLLFELVKEKGTDFKNADFC